MAVNLDLDALTAQERYKLLTAVVIPRPIAWVTTVNKDGLVNAAPFSFFNVFGQDPALVILGLERRADGSRKDTECNIDGAFTSPARLIARLIASSSARAGRASA